jgi:hypothetical protein
MRSTRVIFAVGLLALTFAISCMASETMTWLEGCKSRDAKIDAQVRACR